ncbi:dipeptidyl peptidase 2-like [Babylonia areolata]|uniref:dipeptidyl peptidase 2-like n=1 Tax=Babylonia areolata TaxID=304850 RepID=UPI003FD325E3
MATTFALLSCILCVSVTLADVPPYEEKYFNQTIDHFNFKSYGNQTYLQRYLVQDKWWSVGKGPIFFYTGNEGDITDFWAATGFVHDIAPQFGALVIFAEHRYYGKSLPFGDKSFEGTNVGLLTVEQALADYAVLLTTLKAELSAPNVPVIAFGGSYGGMLSAYMRFKYPNVIAGALAASAPIFMLDPDFDRSFFFSLVTKDFFQAGVDCLGKVEEGFSAMDQLAKQGPAGLQKLSELLQLCSPLANNGSAYQQLQGWVRNAFTFLAMLDYPYPTDFLGTKLPAQPVKAACRVLMNATNPVVGLAEASAVYYGSPKCNNITAQFIECADPTGCGLGPNAWAWDYQACTEITLPSGSNGKTDMFPDLPFTQAMRRDYCLKRWGVAPRLQWPSVQFWGRRIHETSNIIFSNGDLDPWRGGGVLSSVSDSVVAILVKGGAHHLDLRGSNKLDPPGVIEAREKERFHIRLWVNSAMTP